MDPGTRKKVVCGSRYACGVQKGDMRRVGQNHISTVCVCGILAGKLPNIRSHTVYVYGFG